MPEPDAEQARFERLLVENYRMVYRVAYAAVGNAADAEEVTQDAFLRAYRKMVTLREPEKFRGWIARMAWRLGLNRRRSIFRTMRRDWAWHGSRPACANPETDAARAEWTGRIEQQIAALPEKLRAVVVLTAIDGLDAAAVAAILKIPVGTVRSRLFLARRTLLGAIR